MIFDIIKSIKMCSVTIFWSQLKVIWAKQFFSLFIGSDRLYLMYEKKERKIKKSQVLSIFFFSINFWGVFRTQLNIYDGTKIVNDFHANTFNEWKLEIIDVRENPKYVWHSSWRSKHHIHNKPYLLKSHTTKVVPIFS